MFSHAEEDVDARSEWAGLRGLQSEVRDSIISYGIILVVQGEENLRGVLEVIKQGVGWEEMVPDEEHGPP